MAYPVPELHRERLIEAIMDTQRGSTLGGVGPADQSAFRASRGEMRDDEDDSEHSEEHHHEAEHRLDDG
jgi:hypothetical protein